MNIFRLTGDLSHLAAIIILLLKIWKSRSCAGACGGGRPRREGGGTRAAAAEGSPSGAARCPRRAVKQAEVVPGGGSACLRRPLKAPRGRPGGCPGAIAPLSAPPRCPAAGSGEHPRLGGAVAAALAPRLQRPRLLRALIPGSAASAGPGGQPRAPAAAE